MSVTAICAGGNDLHRANAQYGFGQELTTVRVHVFVKRENADEQVREVNSPAGIGLIGRGVFEI